MAKAVGRGNRHATPAIQLAKRIALLMYKIGQLAKQFGLSRSSLLYYDRIGLLCPSGRSVAGYRLYSTADVERLQSLCAYRDAGLSLEEIGTILDNLEVPQRDVLERRMLEIGQNIQVLQQQQQMLAKMLKIKASQAPFSMTGKQLWVEMFRAAGMDEAAMRRWHREYEQRAPEDHHAFLLSLDISEKEAIQIRKLSANMETNSMEMDFFYQLYETVDRQGPGSVADTCKSLQLLPDLPAQPRVLDIGCGCGAQTLVLAEQLDGQIIAVDNHQPFLDKLTSAAKKRGLADKVLPQQASMFDLPFAAQSFDLIWSEGAIYIVGFTEGLKRWKAFLKPGGLMAVTDMVWLQENPPQEIVNYWQVNNPNMPKLKQRLAEVDTAGYQLIDHFTLSVAAWQKEYYRPLRDQIVRLREKLAWNETAEKVFTMTEEEAEMYDRYGDSYGYEFFLLQH
jgi:DNA-binding transcriptional MerR regulator/ubiquinone/menaquinone biosynthesis C-methylase UbiE